jgi:phage-related protein
MTIKQLTSGIKGEIAVQVDEAGRCEVLEFIERLQESDQKKIINLFNLFCTMGEIKNEEKFDHEEGKIYAFKSYQIRFLCAFLPTIGKRRVILLHAFKKKTGRLSKSDLEKAQLLFGKIMKSI